MTKTEAVVRSIFGITRTDIRPLICAVDVAIELMFIKGVPMDDILVTKDIYPAVAQKLGGCSSKVVSRNIERLANRCWDILVSTGRVASYIGAPIKDIAAPRDIIFYLAFYVHLGVPFFEAIEREPTLLFN